MKIDPWIETASGIKFEFLDPKPEQIVIEDIAHALAHQCRFNGHVNKFYSVAEHSIECSGLVPDKYKLQALMHDASEAYITDIASPVKQYLSNYKELEKVVMDAIANKFGFEWPMSKETANADLVMLSEEARNLMPGKGDNWNMWEDIPRPEIFPWFKPACLSPTVAKRLFLQRFEYLTGTSCKGDKHESLSNLPPGINSVWSYADSFNLQTIKIYPDM